MKCARPPTTFDARVKHGREIVMSNSSGGVFDRGGSPLLGTLRFVFLHVLGVIVVYQTEQSQRARRAPPRVEHLLCPGTESGRRQIR